jgi:hypothetical protein
MTLRSHRLRRCERRTADGDFYLTSYELLAFQVVIGVGRDLIRRTQISQSMQRKDDAQL